MSTGLPRDTCGITLTVLSTKHKHTLSFGLTVLPRAGEYAKEGASLDLQAVAEVHIVIQSSAVPPRKRTNELSLATVRTAAHYKDIPSSARRKRERGRGGGYMLAARVPWLSGEKETRG